MVLLSTHFCLMTLSDTYSTKYTSDEDARWLKSPARAMGVSSCLADDPGVTTTWVVGLGSSHWMECFLLQLVPAEGWPTTSSSDMNTMNVTISSGQEGKWQSEGRTQHRRDPTTPSDGGCSAKACNATINSKLLLRQSQIRKFADL